MKPLVILVLIVLNFFLINNDSAQEKKSKIEKNAYEIIRIDPYTFAEYNFIRLHTADTGSSELKYYLLSKKMPKETVDLVFINSMEL
jgi:hypothetical protein